MSAAENKELLQHIYAALAWGDRKPFAEAMADDFAWIVPGQSTWSGAWRGRAAVRQGLIGPLFDQFADRYTNTPVRFIAEDDLVVVECRGKVRTKAGLRYDNAYCNIFRVEDGRLKELVEYMDTALAERVLAPPPRSDGEHFINVSAPTNGRNEEAP